MITDILSHEDEWLGTQAWMLDEDSGLNWFELLTDEVGMDDPSALFHVMVLTRMEEFFDRQGYLKHLGVK